MLTVKDAFNGELAILGCYVVFLLLMPRITMKTLGLAQDTTTFWPRVLGALGR